MGSVEIGGNQTDSIMGERLAGMDTQVSDVLYPPFPRILMVELTNVCNHACLFCANGQMTRPPGFIDAALLKRLLREGYDLGGRDLALHSTGEATLDSRLPYFVQYAKEIGYSYIYLTTNGSASLEFYHSLVKAGMDSLKFSINGAKRASYQLTHGKDDFDKVMGKLRSLDRWRKDNKHPLRLLASFIYTKVTEGELDEARDMISPLVDDFHIAPVGDQGGQIFQLFEYLKLTDCPLAPPLGEAKPCSMLWSRAHVSKEGYLTVCCVDYENNLVVCDLNSTGLKDGWRHPVFVDMRRRHLSQQLEGTLCWNCLYQRNEPFLPLCPDLATVPSAGRLQRHIDRVKRAVP